MGARLKDGLYIGESRLAIDLEFIVTSKVTGIINCSYEQDDSLETWDELGIGYLYYPWTVSSDNHPKIFSTTAEAMEVADELCAFIDTSLKAGESILIHAKQGSESYLVAAVIYFMAAYYWSLKKTLEFMQMKIPFATIQPPLLNQLYQLECAIHKRIAPPSRALDQQFKAKAASWVLSHKQFDFVDVPEDHQVLENTFVNSTMPKPYFDSTSKSTVISPKKNNNDSKTKKTLRWIDFDCPEGISKGKKLILSPFSKTPLPERPAGASYNSLESSISTESKDQDQEMGSSREEKNNPPSILRGGSQWLMERRQRQQIELAGYSDKNVLTTPGLKVQEGSKLTSTSRPRTRISIPRRNKSQNQETSLDDLQIGVHSITSRKLRKSRSSADAKKLGEVVRERLSRKDLIHTPTSNGKEAKHAAWWNQERRDSTATGIRLLQTKSKERLNSGDSNKFSLQSRQRSNISQKKHSTKSTRKALGPKRRISIAKLEALATPHPRRVAPSKSEPIFRTSRSFENKMKPRRSRGDHQPRFDKTKTCNTGNSNIKHNS